MTTFRVKQDTCGIYTATLRDENGDPIPANQISSMVLTLYNGDSTEPSAIINDRDEQNVFNQNDVTIHATSGLLTWSMTAEDNPIIDETRRTEVHIARFDFSYGTPTREGWHEVRFRVVNARRMPKPVAIP